MPNKKPLPIIQINGVSVRFRTGSSTVQALKDVDLSIDRGSLVAIMGRSGSGKSTLAHILGLMLMPDEGQYRLEGRDVGRLPPEEHARLRGQHIGFVFQQFHLLSRLTVIDNVRLPLIYSRDRTWPKRRALARSEECLAKVGLSDRAGQKPATLSGGEQQRVAIARAIINDPAIILADEPTGALDTAMGNHVTELLETLCRRDGRTVLIITHDPEIAARCPRRIKLNDGRLSQMAVEDMNPRKDAAPERHR